MSATVCVCVCVCVRVCFCLPVCFYTNNLYCVRLMPCSCHCLHQHNSKYWIIDRFMLCTIHRLIWATLPFDEILSNSNLWCHVLSCHVFLWHSDEISGNFSQSVITALVAEALEEQSLGQLRTYISCQMNEIIYSMNPLFWKLWPWKVSTLSYPIETILWCSSNEWTQIQGHSPSSLPCSSYASDKQDRIWHGHSKQFPANKRVLKNV